jgi:hypothetical protein
MSDINHARIIERLGDTHEERILSILKDLEERIATIVIAAPVTDGKLNDLAWAVKVRAEIEQSFRQTFLTEADASVRSYDEVAASLTSLYSEFDAVFQVSDDILLNLKRVSFQGFQDIASRFTDELANELYQNTLTGRPVTESVQNLRQKINGVYIQSDKEEINRLVAIAQSDSAKSAEAIEALHRVYAADRTGNNMRRFASQMVHDSLMQYDASLNVAAGKEIGADQWKYYGSVIRDSRDWCKKHAMKTYTEEEIREMWSSNSWTGKAPGDPFIVRGGYNCRHHWRPVFDTEVEDA